MFTHWFIMAGVYLLFLSIMDVRNKMRVDARPNYVMVGLTFGLLPLVDVGFWFVVGVLAGVFFFHWFLKRFFKHVFGNADIVALSWLWLGFVLIDPVLCLILFAFLFFCVLVVFLLKRVYSLDKMPFLPAIFASFAATTFIYLFGGLA